MAMICFHAYRGSAHWGAGKNALRGLCIALAGLTPVGARAETQPLPSDQAQATGARIAPPTVPATMERTGRVPAGSNGASARGVFRSYETAAISAELNARITHLPQREGDRFRKGDLLVSFDCRRMLTEREAAMAVYQGHRAAHEAQRNMQQYKAAGSLAVDQSKFEMERAAAEMRGLDLKIASCAIHAPFNGRIVEKIAQIHEIAQPNQPLIRIINDERIELVLMIPSAWLSRFEAGTSFKIHIDESGQMHNARVIQWTGMIDPVSQSARLIAELHPTSSSVLPGMSGTAHFNTSGDSR